MKYINRIFFSVGSMALMILIFLVALIIGTWIENDYGTQTAKLFIYNSKWLEILMIMIGINLIVNIGRYKMFRREKTPALVFHLSFLIILIGAGTTRYFGFEGIMPIREGEAQGMMHSADAYVQMIATDLEQQYKFEKKVFASPIADNSFENSFQLPGHGEVKFEVLEYLPKAVDSIIEDDSFNTIVELVVPSEKGGMQPVYLESGKTYSNEGLKITLNLDSVPDAIKLFTNGSQVSINTPYDIAFMKMSDQSKGEIKKDSLQPLLQRQLNQVNGKSFVFKHIYESASLEKVSLGVKSEKGVDALKARLTDGDQVTEFYLAGGEKRVPNRKIFTFNGLNYIIGYGAKDIQLPFLVGLEKFTLERYPGSNSPSSFASDVIVQDSTAKKVLRQKIFMNNVLDYKGYRFFQSSYMPDEHGTILSVNHDWWGTNITYLGYLFMGIGMILSLFMKGSRFKEMQTQLKKVTDRKMTLGLFIIFGLASFSAQAQTEDHSGHNHEVEDHTGHNHAPGEHAAHDHEGHDHSTHSNESVNLPKAIHSNDDSRPSEVDNPIDKAHAEKFGTIVSQSHEGRLMPMHTVALNVLRKVHRQDFYKTEKGNKLTPMQVYLDMQINQKDWLEEKIILVSVADFQEEFNLSGKYVSMHDFFDKETHEYILEKGVNVASQKSDKEKGKRDKEIIKVNDRFQSLNMALTGYFTQIYPNPADSIDTWHNPQQALFRFKDKDSTVAVLQYMKYLVHLKRAKAHGNYDTCNIIVDEIIASQKSVAGDVMPTDTQVSLEIRYNKSNVFYNLTKLQMLLGFTLLILLFIQIFISSKSSAVKIINAVSKGIILIIIVGFIAHGLGLGARWYISGHAPWSNGYEALMFISFITILAGLIFARRSKIALACAVILASLMLFVGHMNTMNPEITNLVPVLKSYWLMIHVAIITSSYGFLGLGCILGLVNLFIDLFRKKTSSQKVKDTYKELTYITEMTITIGLFALSIGTFLGGVWANESWGRYWGWDAKETWAFISMLVYSIILHFRYIPGLKGRSTFNFASTIGYVSIIFTFYGVNYLLGGLHSYAKGDPVPIPAWIYYTIGVVIALGVVAMVKERKRKKK